MIKFVPRISVSCLIGVGLVFAQPLPGPPFPHSDRFPPQAESQTVEIKPTYQFKHYSDIEADPGRPLPVLNNYVINLHSTALPFAWPEANLGRPTRDPLRTLDDSERNSRSVKAYELNTTAEIRFGQQSQKRPANVFVVQKLAQTFPLGSALPPLETRYDTGRIGDAQTPLQIRIYSSVAGGIHSLQIRSTQAIGLGLAFEPRMSDFLRQPGVTQTPLAKVVDPKEVEWSLRLKADQTITLFEVPANEWRVWEFKTPTGKWEFYSIPILTVTQHGGRPAGMASVWGPSFN